MPTLGKASKDKTMTAAKSKTSLPAESPLDKQIIDFGDERPADVLERVLGSDKFKVVLDSTVSAKVRGKSKTK